MSKFCVDLTQTVHTTYRRYIEANSKEDARTIAEKDFFDLDDYEIKYEDFAEEYIEIKEIK